MRFKRILPTLLLVFTLTFIMGMSLSAFAAEDEMSATITGNNVRLRSQSSTSSEILAQMKLGTKVIVTGQEDDWYMVRYKDMNGFVFGEFVLIDTADDRPDIENEEGGSQPGYINANNVRLRASGSLSANILRTMSINTVLTVNGLEGDWYSVTVNGDNGYVFAEFVTIGMNLTPVRSTTGVEVVDWSEGKRIMRPGVRATLIDVATGISFEIRVMSSGSHADVEPLTADDTASIRRIRGGSYSWTPRASLLLVGGRTIAVSVNGMPHGGSTIRGNNFSGHFCVHFLNSRNHYNNRVDSGHQRQIQIAARA